jgi:hypothetical protein
MKKPLTTEEINTATAMLLGCWVVLLVPWFIIGPLSAMAFDSGPSVPAYVFAISALTYPISVIVVAIFRGSAPWIVFLPCLNLGGFFIAGKY